MATTTWKEAFGTLQRNAQTLRTQQEPDLDNLLALVTDSMDAYKVCKSRIVAVEQALEQALGAAEPDGGGAPARNAGGDAVGGPLPAAAAMPEEPPGFFDDDLPPADPDH